MLRNAALLTLIWLFFIPSAQAYLGPGLGAGTIGAIFGVIGAFLLGIFGVLYYPIKRMLKKRKAKKAGANAAETDHGNNGH